jgi:hypothetical protein
MAPIGPAPAPFEPLTADACTLSVQAHACRHRQGPTLDAAASTLSLERLASEHSAFITDDKAARRAFPDHDQGRHRRPNPEDAHTVFVPTLDGALAVADVLVVDRDAENLDPHRPRVARPSTVTRAVRSAGYHSARCRGQAVEAVDERPQSSPNLVDKTLPVSGAAPVLFVLPGGALSHQGEPVDARIDKPVRYLYRVGGSLRS